MARRSQYTRPARYQHEIGRLGGGEGNIPGIRGTVDDG